MGVSPRWEMGYHAEHHLYPFFPFWQLPRAHGHLEKALQRISPSHLEVNLGINPIVTLETRLLNMIVNLAYSG